MDNEELDEIVNDEVSKQEAPKVVPAYAKKENKEEQNKKELKKEKKNKKVKKEKNKNKKFPKIIFIIILVLIVAGIIALSWYLTRPNYDEYRQYEEKMHAYSFDAMYDNGSALTEEKVTKSEAIKMIVSTMLNTDDIHSMGTLSEKQFQNADYVEYAIGKGIISEDEINEKNADDTAKYEDILNYIENSKKLILKDEVKSDVEVKAKNYNNIPSNIKIVISDLVSSGIIDNQKSKINLNQKVFKGMLNKMLINIAEKYNTITIGESKLNINPDKVPSNADQYTYILSNVDKKIYEYDFIIKNEDTFVTPKESYLKKRNTYSSIPYYVEGYYNTILNVDYETIDESKFYNELNTYLSLGIGNKYVKEYVDYVKENRIKIKGSAKAIMPAVYYSDGFYKTRTKVEFEVINSNTQINLLMFDSYSGKNYQYKNEKYSLIVDTKMGTPISFDTLHIFPTEFVSYIVSDKSGIE